MLSSTSGTIMGMYAPSKTCYAGGYGGIKFPCHDGFYYTVQPIPDVAWAIYLPTISWITLYNPSGEAIYADYFLSDMYFTICRLSQNTYLLGVADREMFISSMTTTAGWDPSYKDPKWVYSGLYLIRDGKLEPLVVDYNRIPCSNQRFAKYNKSDKWTDKIKEM